jgi:ATP-binding cassette subfamily B protein
VAIARTILLDPRILILDDSTSSVDMETEYLIQQALDAVMRGRTSFVVASRVRTIKNADQILVLDAGRIIERGTHNTLLARGGAYAKLYDLQLREQEEFEARLLASESEEEEQEETGPDMLIFPPDKEEEHGKFEPDRRDPLSGERWEVMR